MKIMTCKCSNSYQDKKYGKGRRAFNEKSSGGFRCTVCEAEKGA